jgi:pimeloyl-ACP methyl ester carboxylesterase
MGNNDSQAKVPGQAKARTRVLSRSFNEMAIGTDAERCDGYDPKPDRFSGCIIEDLLIDAEYGDLTGYVYRPDPAAFPEPLGAVIFFSGSGGSNASMAGPAASAYNRLGALVIGVDYRGFGRSNNSPGGKQLDGSNITEASLYEDGNRIYRYVRNTLGFASDHIILHGFSLGGAVAARVAADAAERGEPLGGLVLHSSIYDMAHAAAGTLHIIQPFKFLFGLLGAALTGGDYNTASHLKRLVKYDPRIPIHFRGGSAAAGDDLSLEITHLDRIRGFSTRSVYQGREGHQAGENGSKQGVNMSDGLELLERLLKFQRN